MVAHAYNPSHLEGQTKAKSFQGSTSANKKLVVMMHVCHRNHAGSINRRISAQGINMRPYFKNNQKQKWLGYGSSGQEPA
jgi:hypothetical protein